MSIFGRKIEFENCLGTFTGHILDWYDGPLLIKCSNASNESFICILQEREDEYEQWLYIPMSERRIQSFLQGNISFRHLITEVEGETLFLADCYYEKEEKSSYQTLHPNDFPKEDLPSSDVFYDYEDITFEE